MARDNQGRKVYETRWFAPYKAGDAKAKTDALYPIEVRLKEEDGRIVLTGTCPRVDPSTLTVTGTDVEQVVAGVLSQLGKLFPIEWAERHWVQFDSAPGRLWLSEVDARTEKTGKLADGSPVYERHGTVYRGVPEARKTRDAQPVTVSCSSREEAVALAKSVNSAVNRARRGLGKNLSLAMAAGQEALDQEVVRLNALADQAGVPAAGAESADD